MPQMMPMMWVHTLLFTLFCFTVTVCLTYFLFLPYCSPYFYLIKPSNWIWKW